MDAVVVQWFLAPVPPGVPEDEDCEVNFLVRWKRAAADYYTERNSVLIQSGDHAKINVSMTKAFV